MKSKKIKNVSPNEMIEQHEADENDFKLGYIVNHSKDFALMRQIDVDGVECGYFFWDYKMDSSRFYSDTEYIKEFDKFIQLAKKNGLKNPPRIKAVEKLKFNKPIDELMDLLKNKRIYTDIDVFNNETKELTTFDGYITHIGKKHISIFTPERFAEKDLTIGRKQKIKIDDIYSFSFNTWEYRFITQIINETLKK